MGWLLANHRTALRWSRVIVLVCVLVLFGIAALPHNNVDRIVGIVGIALVAIVFAVWLVLAILSLTIPRTLEKARRDRTDG